MADGAEIAKAWVSIIPSFQGGQQAIAKELGGVGDPAGKAAGKGFMGGFAAIATAAAGAVAVGAFVKGAIGAAGDLEQSTGAIDAVFKKSAGQMHTWAKGASNAVGLTENEFNELGTLIGSQLKNGGTAMDQLAPKTNQLIGLGADLSSMFGGTTAEAIEAVSSALKGERDPIEKYGVSLNQAAIDAKAAELGFKKVGGALSAEANQAATVALIMDQTKDAQGNFAKESSTFQGQLQRLTAAWGDVSAQVGTIFLPVLTSVLSFINTNVMPGIKGFIETVSSGKGVFGEISGAFTAMGAAFRDGGSDITSSGLAGFFEMIGLAARYVSDEVSGGFRAMFAAFQDGSDDITSSGIAGFLEGIGVVARNVADVFASSWSVLGPTIMALIPQIIELVSSISPLGMIFQIIAPFLPQIAQMLVQIAGAVIQVLGVIIPLVQQISGMLIPLFMQLVGAVLPIVMQIVGQLVAALQPLIQALGPILTGVISALMPIVQTVFGIIQTVITTVLGVVAGIISAFSSALRGDWSGFWDGIGQVFSTILNGIGEFAGQFFGELPGRILGALGDLGSLLLDAGGQIMSGLWEGLKAGFGKVQEFVGGIGSWIADHKGPKQYDLNLLVPAGGWIMTGLQKGIADDMPALGSTLSDVSWMIQNGIDPNMTASVQARTASSVAATTAAKSAKDLAAAGRGEGITVNQEIHPNDTEAIVQESVDRMKFLLTGQGVSV